MQSNFDKSLAFVLKDEGGNDDDPADHGGRTSRGITQNEYDAIRTKAGLPKQDVWTASDAEIATIYHDCYWLPECDDLPVGIDYMFFDMKVNSGPGRARVLLQRSLGVQVDGVFGPITQAAVAKSDPASLIGYFTEEKRAFYKSLNQPRFLKGWLNRCDHVQNNALTMIG